MENSDHIIIPSLNSISRVLERYTAPLSDQLKQIEAKLSKVETKTTEKKYYRNEDLKRIFQFSNNTIIKYRENGTLPFTKMGDIYLYDCKVIDDLLKLNSSL